MLSDHDVIDRWLRDEIVPVAAAFRADPSRSLSIEEVFDELRSFQAVRRGAFGGGACSTRHEEDSR